MNRPPVTSIFLNEALNAEAASHLDYAAGAVGPYRQSPQCAVGINPRLPKSINNGITLSTRQIRSTPKRQHLGWYPRCAIWDS